MLSVEKPSLVCTTQERTIQRSVRLTTRYTTLRIVLVRKVIV